MKRCIERNQTFFTAAVIGLLAFALGCSPVENSTGVLAVQDDFIQATQSPGDLEEYYPNLIEEFRADLDNLADAPRYQIEVEIGDAITDVSGSMRVEYTNRGAQPLKDIYFRLFPNMAGDYLRVEDVRVNGEPAASELAHQNTSLRVLLERPLEPGEKTEISMSFFQQVPSEMGGNYGLYIFQEDILALDAFFPIIPVFNEDGWQVQDPPPNADMIFTESAFFKVRVSAPDELVLAASGVEVGSVEEGGRRFSTFVGGPQRDFYLAASPRFASESMQVGGTLITSYFPEEYREMGEKVLLWATQAFIIFSERFGSYPYAELDLVSTPMQAGGMEYSGAAALALNLYEPEPPLNDNPGTIFLESATAHELAHQWFFNQVMNNPVQDPWMDEGLAQYLTYVYYRDNYGEGAGRNYIDTWELRWNRVDRADIPIGLPAGEYSGVEYSAIVYGRAPLFMLELQQRLGEEEFSEFLRDYVEIYHWQTVRPADFIGLVEHHCECDLAALFRGWVRAGF